MRLLFCSSFGRNTRSPIKTQKTAIYFARNVARAPRDTRPFEMRVDNLPPLVASLITALCHSRTRTLHTGNTHKYPHKKPHPFHGHPPKIKSEQTHKVCVYCARGAFTLRIRVSYFWYISLTLAVAPCAALMDFSRRPHQTTARPPQPPLLAISRVRCRRRIVCVLLLPVPSCRGESRVFVRTGQKCRAQNAPSPHVISSLLATSLPSPFSLLHHRFAVDFWGGGTGKNKSPRRLHNTHLKARETRPGLCLRCAHIFTNFNKILHPSCPPHPPSIHIGTHSLKQSRCSLGARAKNFDAIIGASAFVHPAEVLGAGKLEWEEKNGGRSIRESVRVPRMGLGSRRRRRCRCRRRPFRRRCRCRRCRVFGARFEDARVFRGAASFCVFGARDRPSDAFRLWYQHTRGQINMIFYSILLFLPFAEH